MPFYNELVSEEGGEVWGWLGLTNLYNYVGR